MQLIQPLNETHLDFKCNTSAHQKRLKGHFCPLFEAFSGYILPLFEPKEGKRRLERTF
jgi:hypothetical protein